MTTVPLRLNLWSINTLGLLDQNIVYTTMMYTLTNPFYFAILRKR